MRRSGRYGALTPWPPLPRTGRGGRRSGSPLPVFGRGAGGEGAPGTRSRIDFLLSVNPGFETPIRPARGIQPAPDARGRIPPAGVLVPGRLLQPGSLARERPRLPGDPVGR